MTRAMAVCAVLTLWSSVAKAEPINFDAAYAQGVNAYTQGRYVLAEECLTDAVSVVGDPRAWMFKGLSERAQGKHAEAQESIHQAASLMAAGTAGTDFVNRAIQRVQGPFRLYINDVQNYYVRTNRLPGEVILGAASPIQAVEPRTIDLQPAIPVPAEQAVPAAPAIDPNAPPASPAPVPPVPVTAAKPVVVVEGAVVKETVAIPAVITGAPVYPVDANYYVHAIDGVAGHAYPTVAPCCGAGWGLSPYAVHPYAVGVGAWMPAWYATYVPWAPAWYTTYASWWGGYPHYSW